MTSEKRDETANRVSVWVVEAGRDDPQDPHWETQTQELAILTQQVREDAREFAQRVTSKVERLTRTHSAPERLALVLQDDQSPKLGVHSEALTAVALHLVQSQTQLTIRIGAAS
jgi:hypothetical protein